MPHRRLVKIGDVPVLPTISQFLTEMAAKQHEEIQRLKSEALSGKLFDTTTPEVDHQELTPDPWLLHPVRIKKAPKKKAAKKSAKRSSKVARKTKKATTKKKLVKKIARRSKR